MFYYPPRLQIIAQGLPGLFHAGPFEGRKKLHTRLTVKRPLCLLPRTGRLPALELIGFAEKNVGGQADRLSQREHLHVPFQQSAADVDDDKQTRQAFARRKIAGNQPAPMVAKRR